MGSDTTEQRWNYVYLWTNPWRGRSPCTISVEVRHCHARNARLPKQWLHNDLRSAHAHFVYVEVSR